jgi:hypothetical protein
VPPLVDSDFGAISAYADCIGAIKIAVAKAAEKASVRFVMDSPPTLTAPEGERLERSATLRLRLDNIEIQRC